MIHYKSCCIIIHLFVYVVFVFLLFYLSVPFIIIFSCYLLNNKHLLLLEEQNLCNLLRVNLHSFSYFVNASILTTYFPLSIICFVAHKMSPFIKGFN
uniref:G_PROTEIN_RECEP_F1_2 domain-containing protein n=1 Tax=Heterorhabditis bacteriophora TaxID=37862 RepID=A0A1I7WGU1_HETBA